VANFKQSPRIIILFIMRVLLTGSTGFLGTYIRKNLRNKDISFIYGTTSDIKDEKFVKFSSLYKDIEQVLKNEQVDAIIHTAAVIPKSFDDATYELFLQNVEMMKNLYEFAIKKKIKKFIYLSGFGSMHNPDSLDIKDYYTMSKIVGEHFCSMMREKGINAVSFRISSPFGEYSRSKNVLNTFVEKALKGEDLPIWGTGRREQNFTYAGNILYAIELALAKDVNGTYNIVGEKSISMIELAEIIIKLTGSKSKIVFTGMPDKQENYRPRYSFEKAFEDFGYYPIYTLEEGLERYIRWLKERK